MKKVLHFGAGALGRGLTIYSLVNSGCEVYVAEAYEPLVEALKANGNTYKLHSIDAEPDQRHQEITVKQVLSMTNDMEEIKRLLKDEIEVVTTSVIQENLIHVARIIADVWNVADADKYMILLCENIESASTYFKGLLKECAESEAQLENLMKIRVPDTMVDRGCGKNPSDILEVVTTEFREIAVDKRVVEDTGIALIPSVDNIDSIFARKRYLLNTPADSIAFAGILYHCEGFLDAALDPDVRELVMPYMELVKKSLVLGYGLSKEEVEEWSERYSKRTTVDKPAAKKADVDKAANSSRDLTNVARNMLRKLRMGERFVTPLAILHKADPTIDLQCGIAFIAKIAQYEKDTQSMTKEELLRKLHEMWCESKEGCYIFQEVSKLIS